MTDAERQRRATARRKDSGMVQVRVWVPAHALKAVKAAIAEAVKAAQNEQGVNGEAERSS